MTNQHPITPPLELVQQWLGEQYGRATVPNEATIHVATQAAQWGYQQAAERFPHIANQELEACCNWLGPLGIKGGNNLRAARRPNPPTAKELALHELGDAYDKGKIDDTTYDTIRRALEQLND